MLKLSISNLSINSISSIFSYLKHANSQFVFWIRSANYERQLYVSPTYEAIWKKDNEILYKSPDSWFDTVLQEDLDENMKDFNERTCQKNNLSLFRISTPCNKVKFIKDYSFSLYNEKNEIVAVAGFSECIVEKEWMILRENPDEKIIESAVMEMFIKFTSNKYTLKNNYHHAINLLGQSKELAIYTEDSITPVTKREYECLNCLMSHMSAKQSGRQLDISPRTVETYLSNIKIKTALDDNLSLITKISAVVKKLK